MTKDTTLGNLTSERLEEAKKQEQIIDSGLSTYIDVGFALRKIQDERLHEGKFIDYAMDRFALKKHTTYRLIRAADVAKTLKDAGLPYPKNAGQAHRIHDLAKDDPAEQIELWKQVIESGVPAALSQIDRIANEMKESVTVPVENEPEIVGEVNMDSAHHVEPISIPPRRPIHFLAFNGPHKNSVPWQMPSMTDSTICTRSKANLSRLSNCSKRSDPRRES